VRLRGLVVAPSIMASVAIASCYDVDRLRAERDRPLDDSGIDVANPIGDAGSDTTTLPDGTAADSGDGSSGGLCPSPIPPPTNGLVAFYPLDENSGTTVNDCSTSALTGVVIGANPKWTTGKKGGGLRLSAADGCVQIGTASSAATLDFNSAFTATAWVNAASFPTGVNAGYVVGKTNDPDLAGWRLATGPGSTITGTVSLPTDVRLVVSASIPQNTWVHVAFVVVPGGSMEMYIDGSSKATQSGVPNPIEADPQATARLGCRSDGAQNIDGIVDDVRLFSRALSAAEIAALAQ
jgi:hypothetical protein